ncbi:hypothetical protein NM688_g3191 [Phlebia brevispora]|uniref:Uncharacterized protein n=1 Tax=Phlebia brevispora TaxID=194682 RepID=A0ACC1T6V1_9APHY|nr:hypothetical protein NM688_g3191 [Phlebia brevispora]
MVSNASDLASLSDIRAMYVNSYCNYALTALVVYEYLLVLPSEIRLWKGRWTGSTWLLFLNRYLLFFLYNHPNNRVANARDPTQGCKLAIGLNEAACILQLILFAVFSALRVYAIADRNRVFSILILLLYAFPIGSEMILFSTASVTTAHYRIFGYQCNEAWTWSFAEWQAFDKSHLQSYAAVYVTRISVIIADILCVLATWRKAISFSGYTPLIWVILRDGTIYFLLLLAMNVTQMVLETISFFANTNVTPIATFIFVLTPILTSRFLLNLREIGQEHQLANRSSFRVSTAIGSFAVGSNVLGNLGEPLDHGFDEDILDDDEDPGLTPDTSEQA